MEENLPSRTAMAAAYYRAIHHERDSPKIFDDPLAGPLLPERARAAIEQRLLESFRQLAPQAAAKCADEASALAAALRDSPNPALVLSRARYAEDLLDQALAQGVRQYVILGAGLDTFALRRAAALGGLAVFEVDHPASQGFKRRRIQQLGWACPPQLHFVEADLAREGLASALGRSTFDPHQPGFFSWLGVTYYLPPQAVLETLAAIAGLAASGGVVVLDYRDAEAKPSAEAAARIARMRERLQRIGEPLLSHFAPRDLAREMAWLGLRVREDLSPQDIEARYFQERGDGYHAHGQCRFICAAA